MLLLTSFWASWLFWNMAGTCNCTTSCLIFGHILQHFAHYKSMYYHYYYYYCNTFRDLSLNECY